MSTETHSEILPENWKSLELGEIVKPKYGKSLDKSKRNDLGTVPVVGSAGIMSYTDEPLISGEVIVVGRKGNVGDVQIFKEGVWPIDTVYYFEQPANLNIDFFYFSLISQEMKKLDSSTATPSLRREDLEAVRISIPPPAEQMRIVEILEEQFSRLDAALDSVNAVRQKARRLHRSLLHAAFTGTLTGRDSSTGKLPDGWDVRLLKKCLAKLKSGKYVERGWSPQCLNYPAENSWGVLKTTSVQMGSYLPEYNKKLPESLEPKVGLEVNDGDFLVTTTGPRNRCGVVCYVDTSPKKLIFSGKILRFRTDESQVTASWLMYFLMSPDCQRTLDRLKVGTSDSSVSIGNQQILDLEIPVAPIAEQKRIIEMLEAQISRLDASLVIADEIEKRASELRRSLLYAAFTGELTKEWREGAHV